MNSYDFQIGEIFYRDPIDSKNDKNDHYNLTSNTVDLQEFKKKMKDYGGGDGPEDWVRVQ